MSPVIRRMPRSSRRWSSRAASSVAASKAKKSGGQAITVGGPCYVVYMLPVLEQWLGKPNRTGALIERRAQGRCHACFGDGHPPRDFGVASGDPCIGHAETSRGRPNMPRSLRVARADAAPPEGRHLRICLRPVVGQLKSLQIARYGDCFEC
jgi:hypothetical protein